MNNAPYNPSDILDQTNTEFNVLQYNYMYDMIDKVYIANMYNKEIKDLCLNLKDNLTQFNDQLAGDIQQEYKIEDPNILNHMEEELRKHLYNINNTPIHQVNFNLWINRQRAGEFNPSHNHTGILSFVFYVQVPEEIRQEHLQSHSGSTPRRGLIQFQSQRTNDIMVLNPVENNFLMFTSDHLHQVYPFYSNNTRISVAGNIYGWK